MAEAHVRIDEGIARGPHQPTQAWPETPPAPLGTLPSGYSLAKVLERYLQGETLQKIAASLGVHSNTLNYHLLKANIREQWKEAQVAVSLSEYQDAKAQVKGAETALGLARAREMARFTQWDLERLEQRLFGQKQELAVTVEHHVLVDQALTEQAGSLIGKVRMTQSSKVIDAQVIDSSAPAQNTHYVKSPEPEPDQ